MSRLIPDSLNNYTTTLRSPILSTDTILPVAVGDGAALGDVAPPDVIALTLVDIVSGAEVDHEIIHVTTTNGDDPVIARGQEGTIARAWNAGARVDARATAETHRTSAGTPPNASTSVKGIVRLATAPADAALPTAVETGDPRMSDSRPPTPHNHDDRYYTETEADDLLIDKAPVDSPTLAGTPTAPTPGGADNSTRIATTAFIQGLLAGLQATAQKNIANGYAGLDAGGAIATAALPSSIAGALLFKGVWDAATNAPALASGVGSLRDYYVVSVSGATTLDGISSWLVGDIAVFNGTVWERIPATDRVLSVQGATGAIVVTLGNIGEGTIEDLNAAITNADLDDKNNPRPSLPISPSPAGIYAVPSNVTVGADGRITSIEQGVPGGVPNATTTTKGIGVVSVAPVDATTPILMGANDPRIPSTDQGAALAGTGTPSAGNPYVVSGDPRLPTQNESDALAGTGAPSAANPYVSNDDPRNSNARTPAGSAGGDLGGTYPDPLVGQARGLRETSGPTTLTVGAIEAGEFLRRVGTNIVGASASSGVRVPFNTVIVIDTNSLSTSCTADTLTLLKEFGPIAGFSKSSATSLVVVEYNFPLTNVSGTSGNLRFVAVELEPETSPIWGVNRDTVGGIQFPYLSGNRMAESVSGTIVRSGIPIGNVSLRLSFMSDTALGGGGVKINENTSNLLSPSIAQTMMKIYEIEP